MYLVGRFGDAHIDVAPDEPLVQPGYACAYLPCAYNVIHGFTIHVPESQHDLIAEMITSAGEFAIYAIESCNKYITEAVHSGPGLFQDWLIMYELRVLLDGCAVLCKIVDPSPSAINYMRMITTYDQIVRSEFPMLTKCDGNKYAFEMMTFYELLKRIDGYKWALSVSVDTHEQICVLAKNDHVRSQQILLLDQDTEEDDIRGAIRVTEQLDDFIISPCFHFGEIGMNYPQIIVDLLTRFITLSNAAMQQIYGDIGQIPATDYVYDSKSFHSIK